VTSPVLQIGFSLTLLVAAAALRAFTTNRLVKRKLRLTIFAAAAAAVLAAGLALGQAPLDLATRLRGVGTLVLALAVISFVVVVGVNPLRADRVPAHFPAILQDALVVGLFMVVATVVMQEKFLTTSAVGAVIVGFALQDTLGNAFAGLAIQTEKPFHAGQWIRVGDREGCVEEITWRATKLRTKVGTFVIVPNSVMSREAIVNYSEPVVPTLTWVEVGASYLVPPGEVKAAIFEALESAPLAMRDPAPTVLLMEFGASAIVYRARFWVADFARDEIARDQVRTNIYYVFRRRAIEIPWPIQVEYRGEIPVPGADETADRFAAALSAVPVFAALDAGDRRELAQLSAERLYGAGELIVREGDAGASMFVVCAGRVRVTLAPDGREVATIEPGGFFGEMSLLTGDARTATVSAVTDARLVEITADAFRRFVTGKPSVLEPVSLAVIKRREELERTRAQQVTSAPPEAPASFVARVRRFLGIPA
jgi:small-conductance mechanosensitive channel/CRP-like cAMP-binding protein